MGLTVLYNESELTTQGGKVVIASDNRDFARAIEELQSADARKAAIAAASKRGIPDPRIGNFPRAYPVNSKGDIIEPVLDDGTMKDPTLPEMKIAGYRGDFQVTARLV